MARDKILIGLDIGSHTIKAIELVRSGSAHYVSAFVHATIGPQDAVRDVLAELVGRAGFGTKRVATSVSGRSVIVRAVAMPQMDDLQLRNAIKYEAGKYIPFEVDEVMLDCQRLPGVSAEALGGGTNEISVLLVAAKRSFVEEHLDMIEDIGLIPDAVDVDSFALGNAYEFYRTSNPKLEETKVVSALVDIGASKSNINIVEGETSFFTREIYMGGNDLTEAISKKLGIDVAEAEERKKNPGESVESVQEAISSVLDDLTHEIHLSFDFFENKFDREVGEFYLSGGGADLKGLAGYLEQSFGRTPRMWNPTEFLLPRGSVAPEELKEFSSRLAVATGLASRVMDK